MLTCTNYKRLLLVTAILSFSTGALFSASSEKKSETAWQINEEITHARRIELWRAPRDIRSRNLFWGQGGKEHGPPTFYTFIKEDLNGTTPKLKVRDESGAEWRIKLGVETRSETAASRLVWAVGYSVNQFYFVPKIRVEGLPAQLHRGENLVNPDGSMQNVELRRKTPGEKKGRHWSWRHNPFSGTRELNGLRVMMALLNNWDLKDQNNAIYEQETAGDSQEIYRVTDLGASFGTTGLSWTRSRSKDDLPAYIHSPFIRRMSAKYVDFYVPSRPALLWIFDPPEFIMRLHERWTGRHIPRVDARWMGRLLAQLSPDQIRDALRAGGYDPEEVETLTEVLEMRIRDLNRL